MADRLPFVPETQDAVYLRHDAHEPAFLTGGPVVYSFAECHASAMLPFHIPGDRRPPLVNLPGVSFLSWSTHRDTYAVTRLGATKFVGMVKGHRTYAGTIGFTMMSENPWTNCLQRYNSWRNTQIPASDTEVDDLPPFDLSLVFVKENEPQTSSRVMLEGLQIIDSSKNISVSNPEMTDVYSFMAMRIANLSYEGRDMPLQHGGNAPPMAVRTSLAARKSIATTPLSTTEPPATTGTTDTLPPPTTTTTTTTTTESTTTPAPCVNTMAASGTLTVPLSGSLWYDTGLTILANQVLFVTATGSGKWDPTYGAYPEGTYAPNPTYNGYHPPSCVQSMGGAGGSWAADSCRPMSLAIAVSAGDPGRGITDGLQPNREAWLQPGEAGKIWAIFNDRELAYGDNTGSFRVTFQVWTICSGSSTTTTLTTSSSSTTSDTASFTTTVTLPT